MDESSGDAVFRVESVIDNFEDIKIGRNFRDFVI